VRLHSFPAYPSYLFTFLLKRRGLIAMSEIPSLFAQRPIILRHQKAALYHPFIEAVALTLVDIPITAITLLVFATIVYEAVRLQQSASQFL
jgi:ATP-binding cassette, subfamily G (WHITE), member 2, SNQ2